MTQPYRLDYQIPPMLLLSRDAGAGIVALGVDMAVGPFEIPKPVVPPPPLYRRNQ